MTPIQSNKTVFFNRSGEALNGTIYIGQPSTDPRTNAKTVTFRDSGGTTFTAAQPLKTVNGRIVYNGLPITALVDGEYSLLMFDSAGNQVDYDPSVTESGGGGSVDSFSELLRVGLTLDEIKEFDVSVGDSVRSIGKDLTTDNLGADWLVVSATGNPADDVDLIDFSNGLQGRRVNNVVYAKDLQEYSEEKVTLGGSFSSTDPDKESVMCTKYGRMVVISSAGAFLDHADGVSTATSAVGAIPETYRPKALAENIYTVDSVATARIEVDSNGTLSLQYRDYSGNLITKNASIGAPTISFSIST